MRFAAWIRGSFALVFFAVAHRQSETTGPLIQAGGIKVE